MIEGFVARRRDRWERLSVLLDRASSPRHALSVDELEELAVLYRRAVSDLAIARRDFPEDRATLFVNQLVTRGHAVIYRERPATWRRLGHFFTTDLPREYRAAWPYLLAATALLFLPLVAMALAVVIAPDAAELVLPSSLLSQMKAGETWFDIELEKRSLASSFIMTNNIRVALLALGGGMLAGVGTVASLVYNGVLIGAVAGALIAYGLADRLVGFVSPHGFIELSVIAIAGGCGLMLGRAILWPGLQPRGQALVETAGHAVRLLTGVLPLLVVAGLIEGFISPAQFPWPYKLAIGITTAILLYSYLFLLGNQEQRPLTEARGPSSPGSG
jgi:uncharacterized membrane protein SpoIIM required for sporulation